LNKKINKKKKLAYLYILSILLVVFILLGLIYFVILYPENRKETLNQYKNGQKINQINSGEDIAYQKKYLEEQIKIKTNSKHTYYLNDFYLPENVLLPNFVIQNENKLLMYPKKEHTNKKYKVLLKSANNYYKNPIITVKLKELNMDLLDKKIKKYLGSRKNEFGIFVYDLLRNQTYGLNEDKKFIPASTAKMTVALLVMRDIDSGKRTLNSTYPIQNKLKHSWDDNLGRLPEGTQVKLDTYLRELLIYSSNTAWYHLVQMLGGSWEEVNYRTMSELGINPLFMDPYIGTARMLSKTFEEIYFKQLISTESANYLKQVLSQAVPSMKAGIGQNLKNNPEFINKLGHNCCDRINYVDGILVWGQNTDYIISVLNINVNWEEGKIILRDLGRIISEFIDS